ncbi:unnamed protein product [Cuscuta epithymum]|uniref:Uncharacterized protein n=1 Tax=Cuscuta epithymum TaxID=186058 RepID=A0AAV0E3C4_9ASTE|nr:unnamed protein product [Cuscuta epithymum]
MGSCGSVHKGQQTHMKGRHVIGSKLVNPSPLTLQITAVDHSKLSAHPPSPLPQPAPSLDFGFKEEAFFDSQLYLESDCEDYDFHSVKGDFTPSRGSTPIHHRFSAGGSPTPNKAKSPISSPLTTDRKKRLAELFKESLGSNKEFDALGEYYSMSEPPKSKLQGTPPSSACSTAASQSQELDVSPNSQKRGQCCLPVPRPLLSRLSFSGARKTTH